MLCMAKPNAKRQGFLVQPLLNQGGEEKRQSINDNVEFQRKIKLEGYVTAIKYRFYFYVIFFSVGGSFPVIVNSVEDL